MTYIPTASQDSSWTTAYEVNFAGLTNSSAAGNGSYVIDGKTWTVENFSAVDSIGIVNGTGLVINPNATNSTYYTNIRTTPVISVPLSSLFSSFDPTVHEVRIWFHNDVTTCDSDFEIATFGITKIPYPGTSTQLTFHYCNGYSSGLGGRFRCTRHFRGTNLNELYYGPSETASLLQMDRNGSNFWFYSGTMSGGNFPAANSLTLRGVLSSVVGLSSTVSTITFNNPSDYNIEFTAYPSNTNNSFTSYLARMRVEYRK